MLLLLVSICWSECNFSSSGAAGQIGYSLVFQIAHGRLLGFDQQIELRLLDLAPMQKVLEGVKMELFDTASPLITSIVATSSLETAFKGADIALLVGARPRGPGMERKDLLAGIFDFIFQIDFKTNH